MIQVFADGALAYDSRLEDYDLRGLTVTTGLNKGGTAEIVMPPNHPAYSLYTSYKTIVEIYRDGLLKFRGRVLYTSEDFQNMRTVVCEGELCFFQDAVSRPYLHELAPAAVFSNVIENYNSQVETAKQFKIGEVTVVDENDYIRLESESAETVMETVNKLLERCGGYLVFTTDTTGARVINWYASLDYKSGQVIEFGENLLNFSRNGANTKLATAILPYGAKNETTGERLTIESVNDGKDYIQDDEAVALRGFIIKPVVWDDVELPENLLRKAREYLEQNRYIITALELSALDLSYLDKDVDGFRVGDSIRVLSKPHGVDDDFLLTECTEDLLNPANSKITLGKDVSTLTDADVAGDRQNRGEMHKVSHQIKADYTLGITNAVAATERSMASLIEQKSNAIRSEVSETYTTNDQLTEAVSTSVTQLSDSITMEFNRLEGKVNDNDTDTRGKLNEIYRYIRFEDGAIKLGAGDSAITLTIENDRISFKKDGLEFGSWDGTDFYTGNIVVEVEKQARLGNFAFLPRPNGSLSFMKVRN
jgi:phage minor structural protein